VALSTGVLQEDEAARSEPPDVAVRHLDFELAGKHYGELSARRRVPIAYPTYRNVREEDPLGGQGLGKIQRRRRRSKIRGSDFYIDVLEVALSLAIFGDSCVVQLYPP
jgi:hypothetical protein